MPYGNNQNIFEAKIYITRIYVFAITDLGIRVFFFSSSEKQMLNAFATDMELKQRPTIHSNSTANHSIDYFKYCNLSCGKQCDINLHCTNS